MIIFGAMFMLGQRWYLNTNVSIPLSYVGDDGRTYSCTYDYRTLDRLPMPDAIAEEMNDRDWSETGQLIYEWAKAHPDASWSLAVDRYIEFPPWTIETDNGSEYELWRETRAGSNCEDGLAIGAG